MNVKVLSYKGNVFGVEPPTFVELEITDEDKATVTVGKSQYIYVSDDADLFT